MAAPPCHTVFGHLVATTRPAMRVRQFAPLREDVISFCQCPCAPTGCRFEVYRSDNSLYCDFCFFESGTAHDFCDCSCTGCTPEE